MNLSAGKNYVDWLLRCRIKKKVTIILGLLFQTMASAMAEKRLRREYLLLNSDPISYIQAEPMSANIFEWRYVINGPTDTVYEGGYYYGSLVFPKEFPFQPPSIYMITPSGRFQTKTRLCLSMSDYHPESWNPGWTVSAILIGLVSFMLEDTPTVGSIETTNQKKKQLARASLKFNLRSKVFRELFPEIVTKIKSKLEQSFESNTTTEAQN